MEIYSRYVKNEKVKYFMEQIERELEPYSGFKPWGTLFEIQKKQTHPNSRIDALRTHYGYLTDPAYQNERQRIKEIIARWEREVGPQGIREAKTWQPPELTLEERTTMFMCGYEVDLIKFPDDKRREVKLADTTSHRSAIGSAIDWWHGEPLGLSQLAY